MLAAGLLSLLGCVPAFADAEGFSEEYSRFQDPDGILSGDEAEELNEKLDEISHDQEFDVTAALVTVLAAAVYRIMRMIFMICVTLAMEQTVMVYCCW